MFAKKGSLPLITIVELVLSLIVALIFISSASQLSDKHQIERFAVSKDVSMLIETAQAVPRGMEYEYPETLYQSSIIIKDNDVIVEPHSSIGINGSSISLSRYKFASSSLVPVEHVRVDGRFFTLYRGKNNITFTKERVALPSVLKRPLDDIIVSVVVDENANSFFTQFQSVLLGQLQNSFAVEGEPTLYVGLGSLHTATIFHSDHEETKQLALEIAKWMKNRGMEFVVVPGQVLAPKDSFSIEIALTAPYQRVVEEELSLVAYEVKSTIETFYKK